MQDHSAPLRTKDHAEYIWEARYNRSKRPDAALTSRTHEITTGAFTTSCTEGSTRPLNRHLDKFSIMRLRCDSLTDIRMVV